MAISNGYATLAQVKSALRITDSVDDALIEMAIESASRSIDGFAQRSFYSSGTAVRYFSASEPDLIYIDDFAGTAITIETLNTDHVVEDTWADTDYQLEPLNAYADGIVKPYSRIRAVGDYQFPTNRGEALVKITAVWGWSAVPIAITQACVIQASRIFKRLDSPLGVAGFGEMGAVRVLGGLDVDVEQLVQPFMKTRYFV